MVNPFNLCKDCEKKARKNLNATSFCDECLKKNERDICKKCKGFIIYYSNREECGTCNYVQVDYSKENWGVF